ncbi:sensor histidine kinase [Aeromonas bivalvium]|uniref:sensor histidine kinase n=1 Tax=Aeromonas bivalvium TaxID=440079 RepID=UPI0038CF6E4A
MRPSRGWGPRSLASRTSLFLLCVILAAELCAGFFWYRHSNQAQEQGLISTVRSMALSASSTIAFFRKLPQDYRHLVLEQLRNMGGTRFFVSLNNHPLPVTPISGSQRRAQMVGEVERVLQQELGHEVTSRVDFTSRADLRVFNTEIPIDDLPLNWAHYSLALGELNPPILVIQIAVAPGAWFYLAAALPAPYESLDPRFFTPSQLGFMLGSALIILIATWWVVRKEIRPIRNLARAATLLDSKREVPEVQEEGSSETRAAIHAFNKMQRRIRSHLHERDLLFSAMSHDLKTPLACLKLRTEMLADPEEQSKFAAHLDEMELMIKGALQYMKETHIHEEIEALDLMEMLRRCGELYNHDEARMTLQGPASLMLVGKPLAIKRCLQNIIDNGIKYGERLRVQVTHRGDKVRLAFSDQGPGISPALMERVFDPYFRVASTRDLPGSGLGLTIARHIARIHGGDIHLHNHQPQGLTLVLELNLD